MEKIKREKRISKAICLTLAIILWFYVSIYENPTMSKTAYDVPVKISDEQIDNLKSKGFSVKSISQDTVDVEVTSQRLNLSKLNSKTLTANINIDFSKIKGEGNYSFPLRIVCSESINASYFPEDETIEIVIEPIKSDTFKIEAVVENNYIAYDSYELGTKEVVISAPKSIFDKISSVKTESIKIDKEIDKVTKSIVLYDKDGKIIENDQITITPKKIDISFSYFESKTVSVVLKSSDDKEYILPAEHNLEIYGRTEDLNKISRVNTDEVNISAYIENSEIDVKLELPEGIKVAEENEEITIKLLPAYFN